MNNKRVTLKDISQKANISVNSVSRALRGCKNISLATQEKVKKIADELGYIPDVHARSLRGGAFPVIAIVYDNLINPYYSIMLHLINEQLIKNGYEAMIFIDHHALGHLSDVLAREILSYHVKGILTFLEPTPEARQILSDNQASVVLIGRNGEACLTNSVSSDDAKGGALAAKVLLENGGHSFCYITKHAELDISTERLKGFKDYLNEHGVELDNDHIIVGNLTHCAEDELLALLKKDPKLDSIFCFSDLNGWEMEQCLLAHGYQVPKDINLVGFDNLQEYLPYPIRLSSIDGGKHDSISSALDFFFKDKLSDQPLHKIVNVSYGEGNTVSPK